MKTFLAACKIQKNPSNIQSSRKAVNRWKEGKKVVQVKKMQTNLKLLALSMTKTLFYFFLGKKGFFFKLL